MLFRWVKREWPGFDRAARKPNSRPRAFSQFGVAAVAEGLGFRMFAAAEKTLAGFFRHPGDGRDVCRLVRAIAERLLLGLAAGAPPIGFPRLDIDRVGRFLGDLACGHCASPERGWTHVSQ